ncbi:hypothetical protein EJP82_20085 [Paenibacillus anaericanus]|uniref:Uncharacterized protein n=1 Tax=Paenibacillus anaericanus TaxID=170367 RepID=A0A3S1K434_9BACL|nr:hypothetical protein EJP82_20085 [Paenibacillus anaericanus]
MEQALGSPAAHSSRMQEAPANTVQRIYLVVRSIPPMSECIVEKAWNEVKLVMYHLPEANLSNVVFVKRTS